MISNKLQAHIDGAYTQLDHLISSRFAAKELKIHQRNKALSLLIGPNKSNFRGRGIEFEEVRVYQAGDDIRSIDWRVTARSNSAYTKLFREERERPVLIMVDQRQPMFFGSQYGFKSVLAANLASTLAWSALHNGDRIGGLIIGNEGHKETKPRRSRQAVLGFLHQLHEINQRLNKKTGIEFDAEKTLIESLIELRRIAKPGSTVFIISDLKGFGEQAKKQLFQLAKHCEVTVLFTYDPMEKELPQTGQYTITNGNQRKTLSTGNQKQRELYSQQFDNQLSDVHSYLARLGIPVIDVNTYDKPMKVLFDFYGKQRP